MTDIAFCCRRFSPAASGLIDAFMLANRQMATRGRPGLRWRLLSAERRLVASSLQLAADGRFAELRAGR